MGKIFLFDWGDTLMVDFPGEQGRMCDWETVAIVDGARETLEFLSQNHHIYIATGASESTEHDIRAAFERVDLAHYVSGYFCKNNLGLIKGSPKFYTAIVSRLKVAPGDVTMVGDSYEKDIQPAVEAGLQAVWLTQDAERSIDSSVCRVSTLLELCESLN